MSYTLYPGTRGGYPTMPSMPVTRAPMSPSTRPTFTPTSRTTVLPALTGSSATEPPTTQRSATTHPRFDAAARHEATNLLAVMRLNVDFLESLLREHASALAVSAVDDLHQTIDRLERRLGGAGGSLGPRRSTCHR